MTAAETLAAFTASLAWERVEPALRAQVKAHVLDTLGVICAGVPTREGRAVFGAVARWGGVGEATAIGCGRRLPAPLAAFANAFHGRIHTYDDTYEAGPVHPGSAVVSAALAAGEAKEANGGELLAAILAGYEVATRVSAALGSMHYGSGFHNTGTCNAFGACAAAARAYGLSAEGIADALGLAGEAASGLRQYQLDGSMADTALNGARAAQSGVVAVELQRAGISGPHAILDGRWGILRVMTSTGDVERLTEGLGSTYLFSEVALKPYPSCRFTHGPIDALLGLRAEHRFAAGDVASIEIATFRESVEVSDKPEIRSRTDAVLSHQYVTARALYDGGIALEAFEPQALAQENVRALAGRVRVVHDPALQSAYPQAWPHRITVALKDGRRLVASSDHPPGGARSPLAWDRVEAKFLSLAIPVLGTRAAERVAQTVSRLDEIPHARELARDLAGT